MKYNNQRRLQCAQKLTLKDWRYLKSAFKYAEFTQWLLCRANYTPLSYRDKIGISLKLKVFFRTHRTLFI